MTVITVTSDGGHGSRRRASICSEVMRGALMAGAFLIRNGELDTKAFNPSTMREASDAGHCARVYFDLRFE